ncbi:hypothetical protein HYT57_03480 [Candidatus Woesearchaeota archaeon]|nr:hypothetical protein [Candidatus Woesearchaeota archaeon]
MEVHEFWLKKHSEDSGFSPEENRCDTYRVALGELIDSTQRKILPPKRSYSEAPNPDRWNKSGSIGFMDLRVIPQTIPKENANPLSGCDFKERDYEEKKVIIDLVGIEPRHNSLGYLRFLKNRAEEIALEWGLEAVVFVITENLKLRDLMRNHGTRLGYTSYAHGYRAVKRLKVNT